MDLKLSNYSTTAAMNGSIASDNATLATLAANYGLKTVVDQHSLDIAARITPLEVDTKVANALLGAVIGAALASELASRDATISGLQASKADASALTAYALQSAVDTSSEVDSKIAAALLGAVTTAALDAALLGKADASALAALLSTVDGLDTPLEVDTKIANALLGLATEAFVAAQLASRDASITALQASKADATLLASYATNAALSASETALQSALDAILAELAALQLSGGGVVNAPAWAGFTTWELLRGSNIVRNLHFVAPLSAALANGDDTLSITADCYSVAAADAALAAALLAYYTSSQVDTLLGDYRTGTAQDAETTSAITAALLAYYTAAQVDALLRLPHGERAGHADAGRHQQFTVLLVDDEVGHQKLAMARHQQALRLQLVVLELLAELHEGPALQVHELVLRVRRALAGVQGLVASEGRVELDEMALELGRRHVAVVLQNPSWGELWRSFAATRPSCSPRLMARMAPFCSKQLAISFTTS